MTEKTFAEGVALILAVFPSLKPEKAIIEAWQNLLADLTDQEFSSAVTKLCREQVEIYPGTNIMATIRKFAGKLEVKSLHPGPEEAWGIALNAADEYKSTAWTDEIAQAQGSCWPQLNANDKVGARMAFLEKYKKLVAAAESENRPPKWWATLGFTQEGREEAQEKAARMNREAFAQIAAPERVKLSA